MAHRIPPPQPSSRSSLPRLAALVLLLLVAFAPAPTSAQRERRDEAAVCVSAGKIRIPRVVRTAECPCFFKGYAFANFPRPSIRFSLYAIPVEDYNTWRDTAVRGNVLPPTANGVTLLDNDLASYSPKLKQFGWSSGTRKITNKGRHVVFSLTSSLSDSACVTVGLTLESEPETCPLRLAGPDTKSIPTAAAPSTYVVGGTRVQNDEFSYYNVLLSTGRGNCTGSLIADDWVLTAAHCGVTGGTIARVGGTDLSNGERHVVQRAVRHPCYFQGRGFGVVRLVNDVAVAKLATKVRNARPMPLNVNARGPEPGTIVRATGYGKRTTYTHSAHLHMVDNVVLSQQECQNRFFAVRKNSIARGVDAKLHVCTGRDKACVSGGVCFGDSGGPIVARTRGGELVQIGITSYGDTNCAVQRLPDVYVRVSQFVPWIQRETGGRALAVAWASIDNNNGEGNGGGGAGAVPVWAIVLGAAFGGFLVIAVVLIAAVKVVQRRRENEGALPVQTQVPIPVANLAGPSLQPSGPPPPPPRSPPDMQVDAANAMYASVPTGPPLAPLAPPAAPAMLAGGVAAGGVEAEAGNAVSVGYPVGAPSAPSAPPWAPPPPPPPPPPPAPTGS